MAPRHAFIADIYSDAGSGQEQVLEAIRGVDRHVVDKEPWASVYYWYIPEDPNDGTVYGLEEYETVKHHLEGHNTSPAFLNLVDTIGKTSTKSEKLSIMNLELTSGFTERDTKTQAGVVRVEYLVVNNEGDRGSALNLLKTVAEHVQQAEPTTQSFAVYKSRDIPDQVVVFARFEDKNSLSQHLRSKERTEVDEDLEKILKSRKVNNYKEAGIGFMKRH